MRFTVAACAVLCMCSTLGWAQSELSSARLNALKASTVFISIPALRSSGSGFVAATKGREVYVATCAHVVYSRQIRGNIPIQITLNSGTTDASTHNAKLVAVDDGNDLAILRFEMPRPPRRLLFADLDHITETTQTFVLGFPFGAALSTHDNKPSVTVSRASISAIHRDSDGVIEQIQLDGELNPGNSGGPVVDRTGRVIGIAGLKVGGTNISFITPISVLKRNLQGRVGGISWIFVDHDTRAIYEAKVELVDPLDEVRIVSILTAPRSKVPDDPGTPGDYKPLPGSHEHRLSLKDDTAEGRVTLAQSDVSAEPHVFQIKWILADKTRKYSRPEDLPQHPAVSLTHDVSLSESAIESDDNSPQEPETFDLDAPTLAEEVEVKLPSDIEDLQVAAAGRYLVLKLRDLPALSIFDTFETEIIKHIRLPSTNFKYAAGGNIALVYFPDQNIFKTYSLKTFEDIKTKPNPFGNTITNLTMGNSLGSRALVRYSVGSEQLSPTSMSLLDTSRLTEIKLNYRGQGMSSHNVFYRDRVHFRSNRDMDMVTEWCTSNSPSGVVLLVRRGGSYEVRFNHDSAAGYLIPGDDSMIYSATGRIWNTELKQLNQIPGGQLIPALGGLLYLTLSPQGDLTVYASGQSTPLGPIGSYPGWTENNRRTNWRADKLSTDQRITFLPAFGRIVFVAEDKLNLIVRPFNLEQALSESGVDYLVVTSMPNQAAKVGQRWEYQIKAISKAGGLKYKASLCPKGMQVSKTGLVTWTPRKRPETGEETVLIEIEDESKEMTFHKFTVIVN